MFATVMTVIQGIGIGAAVGVAVGLLLYPLVVKLSCREIKKLENEGKKRNGASATRLQELLRDSPRDSAVFQVIEGEEQPHGG